MMPFLALLKAPSVLIGLAAFLAGAGGATWTTLKIKNGEIAELRLGWAAEKAKQEAASAEILRASVESARAKERSFNAFKDEQEKKDAKEQHYIHGLRLAHGRLLDAHGGLYDRNGRPTGKSRADGGGGDPGAGGSGDAPAPGCVLSRQVSDDLLDLARDADLVLATARACQADAVKVREIFSKTARRAAP